jgi:hypothetical protein
VLLLAPPKMASLPLLPAPGTIAKPMASLSEGDKPLMELSPPITSHCNRNLDENLLSYAQGRVGGAEGPSARGNALLSFQENENNPDDKTVEILH